MSRYVIRRIRLAHCARGPEWCAKCRELDREALCLLDVDPPDYGMVARRMIEVEFEGAVTWREFDVVRVFESAEEARAYVETKPLILITGAMGVGKSTVCQRLVEGWRERGGVPGGLLTRTAGPERYLVDAASGEERLLAAEGAAPAGPRWGRFSFSPEALAWGNEIVRRAVAGPADLVLLDEVGPLELAAGEGLLPALNILLGSEKAALVVVRPTLLTRVQALAGARTVRVHEVTLENRDTIPPRLLVALTNRRPADKQGSAA